MLYLHVHRSTYLNVIFLLAKTTKCHIHSYFFVCSVGFSIYFHFGSPRSLCLVYDVTCHLRNLECLLKLWKKKIVLKSYLFLTFSIWRTRIKFDWNRWRFWWRNWHSDDFVWEKEKEIISSSLSPCMELESLFSLTEKVKFLSIYFNNFEDWRFDNSLVSSLDDLGSHREVQK